MVAAAAYGEIGKFWEESWKILEEEENFKTKIWKCRKILTGNKWEKFDKKEN